jgi:mannose-6-phosphate isomerase
MRLLRGPIRGYAWGSLTAIGELQGRPTPTAAPEAELWLGAHPSDPSLVTSPLGDVPLTEVIAADPMRVLGPSTVDAFGERLPFLLKVLAAAQPLSLQAHPDLEQARAGYAAERAAGTDPAVANYVDAWHKPELLVALEPFDALCGFRDPAESADLLAALDVPALKAVVESLRAPDPAVALREAVQGLLNVPASRREGLVSEVAAAARARATEHPSYELAGTLAERYPEDVGVVVAMLLNRVLLEPSDAVWMPAGNLHAYLKGVGVEIMAASDNVLRGGLTPKHVDVSELVRVLRFEVLRDPVVRPQAVAPGVVTWPAPVADFALRRAVVSTDRPDIEMPGSGPRIVLCLRGSVRVDDGERPIDLARGQAAFAPASAGPLTVRLIGDGGVAELYQASVGDDIGRLA